MSVRIEAGSHTFRDAFAKHVGRDRRFKVHDIAPLVGKSPSLVEKWLTGCRVPCADTLAHLFHILGDAFVRHYIAPHGYQVTQIADNGCPRKAMALSAKATSTSAEAMADGVIDGNEIDRIQADHMAAAREWNAVRMGRCG